MPRRAARGLPADDEHDLGIEGYSHGRLIGQGGFGNVYECFEEQLGRKVAIKVLAAPALDASVRASFEKECRAIGVLSGHPHIVGVYGCGINSWGRPFIVMELMGGGSLAEIVRTQGPLEPERVAAIGEKIAGAVASAHAAGIQHRDIKPENVLISSFGDPKLGDFGISKLADGTQTRSGFLTGSLLHAAPEVLDGDKASTASDLYSLGSTLFELLAGHAAFQVDGDSIAPVIRRILSEPVPDLRARGVPGDLCAAIERAMEKKPADRFGSVAELQSALGALALSERAPLVEPDRPDAPRAVEKRPATLHHARRDLLFAPEVRRDRPRRRRSVGVVAVLACAALAASVGGVVLRTREPRLGAASARRDVPSTPTPAASPTPVATSPPRAIAAATRNVAIGYKAPADALHGRIASSRRECRSGRVVTIRRVEDGDDVVIGTTRTEPSGWWNLRRPHADGTFYATVGRAERRLPGGGTVTCSSVRSRKTTRRPPAPQPEPVLPPVATPAPVTPTVAPVPTYVPPPPTPRPPIPTVQPCPSEDPLCIFE